MLDRALAMEWVSRVIFLFCGNGDHNANGTRLKKLKEMQGVLCAEGCLRN